MKISQNWRRCWSFFFCVMGGEMTSLITQTGPLYMESSYHVNLSLYPLIRRIIWFYPASSFYSVCINDRRILKRLFQDLSTKMALTPLLLPKSPNMDIFFYWFSFFCFVLFLLIIPPDARINQVQESWLGAPKIVRELHTGVKPVHRYSKMIIIKGGKKRTLNSSMLDSLNSKYFSYFFFVLFFWSRAKEV